MGRVVYGGLTALLLFVFATPVSGRRAVATWDGGSAVDSNWTTAENWVGDVAPLMGDDLVFPDGAARLTNFNDFANGTAFASISFPGASGGYTLSGNSITLQGDISASNNGGNHVISLNLSVGVTANIATTANLTTLIISGNITGNGAITKNGIGVARLSGNNGYMGTTQVNQGYLVAASATALGVGDGTAGTGTQINAGGSLQIGDVTVGNEAVTVFGAGQGSNGALQAGGPSSQLGGPVTLGDASTIISTITGRTLTLTGVVSGAGRLGLGGAGTLVLSNSGNNFAGPIQWGATGSADTRLQLGASNVIPDALAINLGGSGVLDLNGFDETVASLAGGGSTQLNSGGTLTLNQMTNTNASGPLSGSGNLIKNGTGELMVSGNATATGSITANAGRLRVTGNVTTPVIVNGATLDGDGNMGPLTGTSGTINPGLSPGRLDVGATTMAPGMTFTVEIDGATPATQYDQLGVTGTIALGGATLDVVLGYVPTPGTSFIIIDNDAADAVTGTFAGLAEGAGFMAGGQSFVISYLGGDGNDVVLTAAAAVPTVPPTVVLLLLGLLLASGAWYLRRRPSLA